MPRLVLGAGIDTGLVDMFYPSLRSIWEEARKSSLLNLVLKYRIPNSVITMMGKNWELWSGWMEFCKADHKNWGGGFFTPSYVSTNPPYPPDFSIAFNNILRPLADGFHKWLRSYNVGYTSTLSYDLL